MNRQYHLLLILVICGLVFSSCKKEEADLPEACFVVSEERKVGIPIGFSTSCTLNASSYDWDFGDGQSSEEAYPSHTYTEEGDFAVTLTVTNDQGASDAVTHILIIEGPV